MRITSKLLVAAAICGSVLVPASPASSGQASPINVSGVASCISETEVQIAWTVRNVTSNELTLDIAGAVLITHGDQPVTLSPTTIGFDETATGTSNVPAGPGTATLHVTVFENGGESLRQFAGEGSGTVEVPDCRQATTTTTAPAETTTTAPGETTTTAPAPVAAPIPATPTYTG